MGRLKTSKFARIKIFIRIAILGIGLIVLILSLQSCGSLRVIGQGINSATDRASRGALCIMVGAYPCIIGAGISGYTEGKERTRDKIRLENQVDGISNTDDECWFF